MRKIVCFHLFNDYSGSPKVLTMVLKGMLEKGYQVDLVTSGSTEGALDELNGLDGFRKSTYRYKFSENPVVTMIKYFCIQVYTFLVAFRYIGQKDVVFYINTILPLGPAMAGRLMGLRVVYHYHENAFVKSAFYRILAWMMERLAHKIMCVSAYQASFLMRKKGVTVIPNALPNAFIQKLFHNAERAFERKNVLLLGSLKVYKGTKEFIALASDLPQYTFTLVINDTQEAIDVFIKDNDIYVPANIKIYPRQTDVTPFYNQASVVLNLSDKILFIETFGMTVLEALSGALPVIVPSEGGIAEMVKNGQNGYKIDVQELAEIKSAIVRMLSDKDLYLKMSANALAKSKEYSIDAMVGGIERIIHG